MTEENDIFMLFSLRENLLHTFFCLLWAKSRTRDLSETIRIPDTVILSHARVIDWFFTAKDGQIKKKSRQKLNSQLVMDQFAKRAHKNKSDTFSVLVARDPELEEGASATHFSVEETRKFLTEGAASGTLQHFVEPKSESNVVHNLEIVCSWTPNVFYVERRQNINPLTKEKISLYDRTTLQETSKFVKVSPLVCGRATASLEGMCQLIAQHVEGVYAVRMTGLSVHCKIDQNDDIWVLYASALKVTTLSSPPKLLSVALAVPAKQSRATNTQSSPNGSSSSNNITANSLPPRASTSLDHHSAEKMQVNSAAECCGVCKVESTSALLTSVAKRHVIFPLALISFFASMPAGSRFSDETLREENAKQVPEFIRIIHPRITLAQYNAERRTDEWQAEPIPLCDQCSAGLHAVIRDLQVGKKGEIVVPGGGDSPSKVHPAPSPTPQVRSAPPRQQAITEVPPTGQPPRSSSNVKRRTLPPLSGKGVSDVPRRSISSLN